MIVYNALVSVGIKKINSAKCGVFMKHHDCVCQRHFPCLINSPHPLFFSLSFFFFVWADCVTFSCTALRDTQRHMWLDEVVPLEEFQETAGVFFSLPTSVYG